MTEPESTSNVREIVHEGYLTKRGAIRKNWKRRYFTLDNTGRILYFESPEKIDDEEKALGIFDVKGRKCYKSICKRSNFLFRIETPKRIYRIHADNYEALQEWIKALISVGAEWTENAELATSPTRATVYETSPIVQQTINSSDQPPATTDSISKSNTLKGSRSPVDSVIGSPTSPNSTMKDDRTSVFRKSAMQSLFSTSSDKIEEVSVDGIPNCIRAGRGNLAEDVTGKGKWKKISLLLLKKELAVYNYSKSIKKDTPVLFRLSLNYCIFRKATHEELHKITSLTDKPILHIDFTEQQPSQEYWMSFSTEELLEDWLMTLSQQKESITTSFIEDQLRKWNCEIQSDDLQFNDESQGMRGGSGVVKRGRWLKSVDVAIKTLNNLPEFVDNESLASFYSEMKILSEMRHPNVVSMFGFCRKEGYVCLVTEFVEGGDLTSVLYRDQQYKHLTTLTKLNICINICAALIYLHGKKLIHRDLKPGNILIESIDFGKVKVCDFGLSKFKSKMEDNTIIYGTPSYAAPELVKPDHDVKVDVFSFAIIMWEIFTGKRAWDGNEYSHQWQIADSILKGARPNLDEIRLKEGEDIILSTLQTLVKNAWDFDPSIRPSFAEIYESLQKLKDIITENSKKVIRLATIEESTLQLFENQERISWSSFEKSFAALMALSPEQKEQLKELRFLLTDFSEQYIYTTTGKALVEWFQPLQAEGAPGEYAIKGSSYSTDAPTVSSFGFRFGHIYEILSPEWFHGFISASEATDRLQGKGEGAFLFRFSSSPKWFGLSVLAQDKVIHWRIACEKHTDNDLPPFFRIENKTYKSMHEIIDTHRTEPIVGNSRRMLLLKPIKRQ